MVESPFPDVGARDWRWSVYDAGAKRHGEMGRHDSAARGSGATSAADAWTDRSESAFTLALHTQAVIQGAFILVKATGGAEIAEDSIDHLHRYIEMLFRVETVEAKHLTEGASK